MTDDDQYNTYEYDVWGRLRFVYNQSSDLVAEYRYNGLNQRISMHQDTDADGDVDVNDITFYFVHDDRWRVIATYHEDDDTGGTDGPKEQFIHHAAGVAGNGSYIDDVICRLKDANTAWTSASDKTLEERIYYCQNWRHDVVALIDSAGEMVEQARYEAYGTPIGMPLGDVDMNGRVTSADTTQISTWDSGGTYDVRGDLNLDGDVNTTDYNTSNGNTGTTLGRGVLSDDPDTVGNRNGYAGYSFDDKPGFETYHVRNRWYNASLARWLTRDPLEYVDGPNLYGYAQLVPTLYTDAHGLCSECVGARVPGTTWKIDGPCQSDRVVGSDCRMRCQMNPKAKGITVCVTGDEYPSICCICLTTTIFRVWQDPRARGIIASCTFRHEQTHLNQKCPLDKDCDECEAHIVGLNCLLRNIGNCGMSINCRRDMTDAIYRAARAVDYFCSKCAAKRLNEDDFSVCE